MKYNKTKKWDLFTFIVVGLVSTIVVFSFPETTSKTAADVLVAVQPNATPKRNLLPKNYFSDAQILAKSAYVYDLKTNTMLYGKNQNDVLPLASLTKIMTAITAMQIASTSASTTIVSITADDLRQDGDTGLLKDERWMLEDLLKYTLVASSNDGASAISNTMGNFSGAASTTTGRSNFLYNMNNNARAMGLGSMTFNSESGLDLSLTLAGAYGSAKDVSDLLSYGVKKYPTVFAASKAQRITSTSLDGFKHPALNTNILIPNIPSIIAGKTGYTELAGGNLAIIFDAGVNHPVAIVVLGSTYDGRFSDVEKLVNDAIVTVARQ